MLTKREFYTNSMFAITSDLRYARNSLRVVLKWQFLNRGRLPEITMVSEDKVLPLYSRLFFYFSPLSLLVSVSRVIIRRLFQFFPNFISYMLKIIIFLPRDL